MYIFLIALLFCLKALGMESGEMGSESNLPILIHDIIAKEPVKIEDITKQIIECAQNNNISITLKQETARALRKSHASKTKKDGKLDDKKITEYCAIMKNSKACPVCGTTLERPYDAAIEAHMLLHTNICNEICGKCARSFKSHRQYLDHTNERADAKAQGSCTTSPFYYYKRITNTDVWKFQLHDVKRGQECESSTPTSNANPKHSIQYLLN